MKKMNLTLLISLYVALGFAQSDDQNYIKTTELLEPVDINSVIDAKVKKIESVTYFDGFGSAKQSVGIKQSPTQKDIVQHIQKDQFGRTTKQFLALPTTQDSGDYIPNAEAQITAYYQNAFADQHPFSEVRYDNSPLNRKLETAAPGNTWQLLHNSDADHTSKFDYRVNTLNEVFRIEIDEDNASSPLALEYYEAEQLLKNSVKNENWTLSDGLLNTKEVFTDKNGKKIAEFSYESDAGSVKKLSTYYVYDNVGNLRYVLPPKLSDGFDEQDLYDFQENWSLDDFLLEDISNSSRLKLELNDNLLRIYFDYGNNPDFTGTKLKPQVVKSINTNSVLPDMPLGVIKGAIGWSIFSGWILSDMGVAEILNGNLVISKTQDVTSIFYALDVTKAIAGITQTQLDNLAFQYKYDYFNRQIEQKVPGKDWEYMVYDQLDRPILTQDANLRTQHKWLFNKYDVFGRVVYSGTYTNNISRSALQSQVNYFINASSNKANSEARSSTASNVGGVSINYTNTAFPNTNLETLTVSYFDDYNFTDFSLL